MEIVAYFTGITFILSILIVFLNKLINKETKVEKIVKLLPGYNCGACGYGSCTGMANEVLKNKDAVDKCKMCTNKDKIKKL